MQQKKRFWKLAGRKTIIVITHKPFIIDSANKKYRFVEGKVG